MNGRPPPPPPALAIGVWVWGCHKVGEPPPPVITRRGTPRLRHGGGLPLCHKRRGGRMAHTLYQVLKNTTYVQGGGRRGGDPPPLLSQGGVRARVAHIFCQCRKSCSVPTPSTSELRGWLTSSAESRAASILSHPLVRVRIAATSVRLQAFTGASWLIVYACYTRHDR